jgi:hypothetical protein
VIKGTKYLHSCEGERSVGRLLLLKLHKRKRLHQKILKSQYEVSSQRKCTRTLTFQLFYLPRAGLLEG